MVFFLHRRHHVASARVHITGTQGSSPRELMPRPPDPSPAPPIPRPPSPRNGSTLQPSGPGGNQTVIQPGTRSVFRLDDNQTALQPSTQSAFKPGRNQTALQLGNQQSSSRHSQTAFQPDPPIPRSPPPESGIQASKPRPVPVALSARLCPE